MSNRASDSKDSMQASLQASFSTLPVDSARLCVMGDNKRKIQNDDKYIGSTKIKNIKSLTKNCKIVLNSLT